MTIKEALFWAANEIEKANVKGPKSSARLLLCQALEVNTVYLFAYPEKELTAKQEATFKAWVARRAKHEPVWYIAGNEIEFFGQTFYVDQNVLIPRPETELMIERLIKYVKNTFGDSEIRILDLATGSGSIILSIAKNLKATYFASDISDKALAVAIKNANNLRHSVDFREGDLFTPWNGEKFDLIVTNLPYIPHEDLPYLDKDVTQYEPLTALDGGKEGLEIYQEFFEEAPKHLSNRGMIFCEIGHNQGEKIVNLAEDAFPKAKVELILDYAEKERIVIVST